MVKSLRLLSTFQIIFFLFNFHIITSFISLPFSYINKKTNQPMPNTTNSFSYFQSLYKYPVYTSLKVNDKQYTFHITFDRYATYLKLEGSSGSNKNDEYSLDYIGISKAELAKTSFTFDNNKKDITVKDFSVFNVKEMTDVTKHVKESNFYAEEVNEIGLNIYKGNKLGEVKIEDKNNNGYEIEQKTNLIEQLKSQKIISSSSFIIKYDNKNEEKGNIIIGGFPSEYSEKKFIYNNISFYQDYPSWKMVFSKIKYGGSDSNLMLYGDFSLNCGFIQASVASVSYFDFKFFDNYPNACGEADTGDYIYKYCKGEDIISQFKTLSFYLPSSNNQTEDKSLTFDYKDLFIKSPHNDSIYYFQIVFGRANKEWIFGRPFFKKYSTVFDQEKKIVGFYPQSENDYKKNKEFSTNKNSKKGRFALAIIIVLSICVTLLIALLYFKCSVSTKNETNKDLKENIKNDDDENEKNNKIEKNDKIEKNEGNEKNDKNEKNSINA